MKVVGVVGRYVVCRIVAREQAGEVALADIGEISWFSVGFSVLQLCEEVRMWWLQLAQCRDVAVAALRCECNFPGPAHD